MHRCRVNVILWFLENVKMENIAILGSTGSIGTQTLDVVSSLKDRFKVYGLTANRNVEKLREQIKKFNPEIVVIIEETGYKELKKDFPNLKILRGIEGLCELAGESRLDTVVNAIVGSSGIYPTLEAIKNGKKVAIANKEAIVAYGEILMEEISRNNATLLPIDSEVVAVHQCLHNRNVEDVKSIILTASGGPFINVHKEDFKSISVRDAVSHPTWKMGKKISVDSATLMNKGFEVIETHFFFRVGIDKIKVVIHPQSIIHSMVEFLDGSILAQMSVPDMRLPIQYGLTFPERFPSRVEFCNLVEVEKLEFKSVDSDRFPCLGLAYSAVEDGGTVPAVLNAADEVAVDQFLTGNLPFTEIPEVLVHILKNHRKVDRPTFDEIVQSEKWAKTATLNFIRQK